VALGHDGLNRILERDKVRYKLPELSAVATSCASLIPSPSISVAVVVMFYPVLSLISSEP
jgi:hypothetical protein